MSPESRRWPVGVGLAVFTLTVLAAIAASLTYSPIFDADRIKVEGARHRSNQQIVAAAGLEGDVNVFHLETTLIETTLESDPWIAEATVQRRLPSTVIVRVQEREPAVVVNGDVLAADGTALPGGETFGLPVVRGATGEVTPQGGIASARAVAALSPSLRSQVGFVVVGLDGALELRLVDGPVVRWGSGDDDLAKAASLAAFLTYASEQGRVPLRVDVSVPGAPSAMFET